MYEFSTSWIVSKEDFVKMNKFVNKVLKPIIQISFLRLSTKLLLETTLDNKIAELENTFQNLR